METVKKLKCTNCERILDIGDADCFACECGKTVIDAEENRILKASSKGFHEVTCPICDYVTPNFMLKESVKCHVCGMKLVCNKWDRYAYGEKVIQEKEKSTESEEENKHLKFTNIGKGVLKVTGDDINIVADIKTMSVDELICIIKLVWLSGNRVGYKEASNSIIRLLKDDLAAMETRLT